MGKAATVADGNSFEAQNLTEVEKGEEVPDSALFKQGRHPRHGRQCRQQPANAEQRVIRLALYRNDNQFFSFGALREVTCLVAVSRGCVFWG